MRIIFNEIKKIFNWKMCIVLLMWSLLIYQMVTEFDIKVFPNGRPENDNYKTTVRMIEDYGQEMDEDEFIDFQNLYSERVLEADKFLSNKEDFNKFGVYSYEDYKNKNDKYFSKANIGNSENDNSVEYSKVHDKYLYSWDGNILWELQGREYLVSRYKNINLNRLGDLNSNQEVRAKQINDNEYRSILPRFVYDNYIRLIKGVAVSIIVGIAFMITPLFIKDKRDKVEYLQYGSKIGRGLFKSKLIAGFISAMIIATVQIIIYSILYSTNNTSMFFKSNINSIFNNQFWFSMTFIQYIIMTVVCVYIISIITAFISMFVSRKVSNYVVGIGVQVPIVFITGKLIVSLLLDNLGILYKSKYLALGVYVVLIVLVVFVIYKVGKKEIIKDI